MELRPDRVVAIFPSHPRVAPWAGTAQAPAANARRSGQVDTVPASRRLVSACRRFASPRLTVNRLRRWPPTSHGPIVTDFKALSDEQVLHASRAGDRDAFGRIVNRYQSLVCALAYSRTGNLAGSQDLAQETFVAPWRRLGETSGRPTLI